MGDGTTNDAEAFRTTWDAACEVEGGVMLVPSGYSFLLQPLHFNGTYCQPNIVFQVDGKIMAPLLKSEWEKVDSQWILFEEVSNGITIRGNGVIDGHGESWWSAKDLDVESTDRPHAIKIVGSFNVTVTGIHIQNSPKFHIFISNTQYLHIFNFSTSSPADSPNTDCIHISNVQHVEIHDTVLACGDDCVSIQTGCSDVRIYNVNCGPGHGYSIGGLGPNNTEAHVSDIAVFNSTVQDSLTGVRIKTWPGGYGSVYDIRFSNITMTNVKTPITIDQNYHGGPKITNDTNAVAITSVVYENITGTYTSRSVFLNCSEYTPCRNLTVASIDIVASEGSMLQGGDEEGAPYCENAYGRVLTNTTPPLQACLLPEAAGPPQAVGYLF
ncbi:UNVERIFIED_CONTAM: Polygalacturonase [Sesamum latifolium]|uniref:Polygalacturonase n=1 Tax=Sesamum latifolium TaxID=2727402 RepID=A0AAW2XCZ7_9LAMI